MFCRPWAWVEKWGENRKAAVPPAVGGDLGPNPGFRPKLVALPPRAKLCIDSSPKATAGCRRQKGRWDGSGCRRQKRLVLFDLVPISYVASSIQLLVAWAREMQTQEDKEAEEDESGTCWPMLPSDLLQRIANMLLSVNVIDYIRLRIVCKSWRSATMDLPLQLPWIMLRCNKSAYTNACTFYRLSDGNTLTIDLPEAGGSRIVGSDNGWLVLANVDSLVWLLDPITRAQIVLPPLTTSTQIDRVRWQVMHEDQGEYVPCSETLKEFCLAKAIVIQSEHSTHHQIRMVIAIGRWIDRLLFTRPGDSCWTMIMPKTRRFWTDVLLHKGQVYAVAMLNLGGEIFLCNIDPPGEMTTITRFKGDTWWWYLVESSGDLLVVGRKAKRKYLNDELRSLTEGFDVYRLDQSGAEAKLVEVTSLGDRMLFLGSNRSLSLSATDFPGWKGNCIYFTGDCHPDIAGYFHDPKNFVYGLDFGVFDLDDGTIRSLPCYPDNCRSLYPPPIWFTPGLFS